MTVAGGAPLQDVESAMASARSSSSLGSCVSEKLAMLFEFGPSLISD